MPVTGQLMRERAHVTGALDIVLAAQGIDAHALAPDIAGGHGQVGDADDHRGTLAVLGHAQAIVDGRIAAGGIEPRSLAHQSGRHAGDGFGRLRRILLLADESLPFLVGIRLAAFQGKGIVRQALGDHDMRQRIDQGHIGAGAQLQMVIGLDMHRTDQVNIPGIGDDQASALADTALHGRAEYRVPIGGIRADDQDHVGLANRVEGLGPGRFAQGLLETIAGGRVADAGAGVDVVVAEGGAHQFLHQISLFVGAAAGGQPADRTASILRLDTLEFGSGVIDGLLPGDFAPGIGDLRPNHRLRNAILVRRVTESKATLDAGMAMIGVTVLVGHHANHLGALHFGLEGAAHAAIGAGRDDAVFRLAHLDHGRFHQGGGRAGLDTGAARHALGLHEGLILTRRNLRIEAAAIDGQGVGALHFLAGSHAAGTDDALGRIKLKIGVAGVLLGLEVIFALVAVAHLAQADRAGHVLEFAVAVGGAGQAVQRMIGDIEFHDATAHAGQALILGADLHALGDGRGAGGRQAASALDLDQTEPAGAEGIETVRRAQLRDLNADAGRRAHDGGAFGDGHAETVDFQRDQVRRLARRGSKIAISYSHCLPPECQNA